MNQSTPPYPASQTLLPGCATRPRFVGVSPGFGIFSPAHTRFHSSVPPAGVGSRADDTALCFIKNGIMNNEPPFFSEAMGGSGARRPPAGRPELLNYEIA